MSVQNVIEEAQQSFHKTIDHLQEEFRRLQFGRASTNLVENIQVEAYSTRQPLKTLAGIGVLDSRTIQIQPWDITLLAPIEKAIRISELGLNPVNDGKLIRIPIPALTEERRRDLTKLLHSNAEDARISIRSARHDAHSHLKQLEEKHEISEDDLHRAEKHLQEKVDVVNKEIDLIVKKKEEDIMTV